jgi:hypothetical protein
VTSPNASHLILNAANTVNRVTVTGDNLILSFVCRLLLTNYNNSSLHTIDRINIETSAPVKSSKAFLLMLHAADNVSRVTVAVVKFDHVFHVPAAVVKLQQQQQPAHD